MIAPFAGADNAEAVAMAVGAAVGAAVGVAVGVAVGAAVGVAVGTEVGGRTLDGTVMESTYVHAESSDTVNVLFVAVVDEYTLNVDWRIWSDVAQPNAKVPLLKCCVRPESWLNEPSDTSPAELYPAASHRDASPSGI